MVIGWPKLLLCSTAAMLVAALVVLAATPISKALSSARLAQWVMICVWGIGLLCATRVGTLLGIRAGVARTIHRLPIGYRLWFEKENPMAEARRAIDRWDSDSERAAFLSCARDVESGAALITDAEERMEYFASELGYLRQPLPAGYSFKKQRLLILLCNGIEKALAEFTPDIVSAAGKPHGDDFDERMDMQMDLTIEEYERRRWYGEDATVLAPRISERAQLSLAEEIVYGQWGRPNYRTSPGLWIPVVLLALFIAAGACLVLSGLSLLVGPFGYGLAVIFTTSAIAV